MLDLSFLTFLHFLPALPPLVKAFGWLFLYALGAEWVGEILRRLG